MNEALRSWLLSRSTWEALISEYETLWTISSDELFSSRRPLGDLPLIVLTAPPGQVPSTPDGLPVTARQLEAEALDRRAGIADLVSLSTRGVHRHVPDSGHVIQYDRPDTVIAAILEVLQAIRGP